MTAVFRQAGISDAEILDLLRTLGRGLSQAAETMRALPCAWYSSPVSEHDLAQRYANAVAHCRRWWGRWSRTCSPAPAPDGPERGDQLRRAQRGSPARLPRDRRVLRRPRRLHPPRRGSPARRARPPGGAPGSARHRRRRAAGAADQDDRRRRDARLGRARAAARRRPEPARRRRGRRRASPAACGHGPRPRPQPRRRLVRAPGEPRQPHHLDSPARAACWPSARCGSPRPRPTAGPTRASGACAASASPCPLFRPAA